MIFVVPFLQSANRDDMHDMSKYVEKLNTMYQWSVSSSVTSAQYTWYLDSFVTDYRTDKDITDKTLILLQINNADIINDAARIGQLRNSEVETFESGAVFAMFDVEAIKIEDAWKNIGLTSFLIFMLTALALSFNNDTAKYVVKYDKNLCFCFFLGLVNFGVCVCVFFATEENICKTSND